MMTMRVSLLIPHLLMVFALWSDRNFVDAASVNPESITILPASNDLPCPDPADIFPCVCHLDEDYMMDLDCSNISSKEELGTIFSKDLPFWDFRQLTIKKNDNIDALNKDCFGQASFQIINIEKVPIQTIEQDSFSASKLRLTKLYITYSQITEFLPFAELEEYTKLDMLYLNDNQINTIDRFKSDTLRVLYINDNKLTELPERVFYNLPQLYYLKLSDNLIEAIEPNTFTRVPSLQHLYLSTNRITELKENTFQLFGEKTYLFLDDNQISYVEPGAIKGVTEYMYIYQNNLTKWEEDIWRPVIEQTASFYAWDNPILCDCSIAWIVVDETLRMKFHGQEKCTTGESIKYLDPALYEAMCY